MAMSSPWRSCAGSAAICTAACAAGAASATLCTCREAASAPATGGICHLVRSTLGSIVPPCKEHTLRGCSCEECLHGVTLEESPDSILPTDSTGLYKHLVVKDKGAGVQAEFGSWPSSVFGLLDCALEQVAFLCISGVQLVHADSVELIKCL